MKKNLFKIAFVVAIAVVSGINVYNAQKAETLSDIGLENVEALASDSEGLPWTGYVLDTQNSCCKYIGLWSIDCSGNFNQCK